MSDEETPEPPPLPEPVMDYEGELWPSLHRLDPKVHPEMLAEQRLIRLEALVARLIELVPIDTELAGVYSQIMNFRPQEFQTRAAFAQAQQQIINKRASAAAQSKE